MIPVWSKMARPVQEGGIYPQCMAELWKHHGAQKYAAEEIERYAREHTDWF